LLDRTYTGISNYFCYPTDIVSCLQVNISIHTPSRCPLILDNPISFFHVDSIRGKEEKRKRGKENERVA
jgi:hypothetical protein